jgi:hypothetical protein
MTAEGRDKYDVDEVEEVYEKNEVPQGWRPGSETIRAIEGQRDTPEQKVHYHHIYPKFRGNEQYSSFFEELGIDVDRWTVAVDEETHLKYIHHEAEWVDTWKGWIDEHRGEATAEEALAFGRHLLTYYGLEGLWEGDADPQANYDVPEDQVYRKPSHRRQRSFE